MALLSKIHWLFLVVIFLFSMRPDIGKAMDLELQEQEIKAGLLYNFLKYTQWPSTHTVPSAPITVCIFGEDPFATYLQPMAGRSVNQHAIVVRTVHAVPDTEQCHLLFVSEDQQSHWPALQRFLSGKTVLTVSDVKDFSKQGGMIEFGRKDNRIHVVLNMEVVTKAKLQVQERLLKLVTVIGSAASKEGS